MSNRYYVRRPQLVPVLPIGEDSQLDTEWDEDATPPSTSRSFTPILDLEEDTQVPVPYRTKMASEQTTAPVPAARGT